MRFGCGDNGRNFLPKHTPRAASGSQMVGRVSMNNKDEFTFHLIGADEDDPGIVFERG